MNPADSATWAQAQQHVAARRWDQAAAQLQALLRTHADAAPVRLLLAGVILAQGGVRAAAEQLIATLPSLPADMHLICRVAQSLAKLGETAATLQCLEHPEIARNRSGPALLALAHVRQGLGQHEQALALMERARAAGLNDADFLYFHALQLQFNGRIAEAEAELEACLAKGPSFGRASLTLARIRRQTADSNHLDTLRARLALVPQGSEDHAAVEFALHKELDDIGRHDQAWEALQRGNDIMHRRLGYDAAAEEAVFDALIERFPQPLQAAEAAPAGGPQPIFIVGMPRSGTTLLERIVGNHSQVAPVGELADLPKQLRWTADRHGHPLLDLPLLEATRTLDMALLGRRYLQQTQWRAGDRRYYVDKLPPNFMLVGFIRQALPQAKILHMVREPMEVCFSNYRALFGDAYAYSYDLESLAHHYRQYRRLMAHWHRVAPGFVLDVAYDALVRDTDSTARRVLDFCGLPFQAQCLDTAGNRAPVATLSSAQVRAPIHQRASGEWRRYAEPLQPLQRALAAAD
ncbi:tetratricopeptide repeat-containing sulfotransferase family protein [Pseudoxanthomonas sacheonensis]|uniref:tetratricopeptide repeat-containing sulfotransferase family protein n=1 Tax=Pseudoxanthomonas sacheonensis TaxID=443615 RepID=UPI0013D15248|nr:sulfotransferase [Pseudoxanthomonas sacheonensis]KAF1708435.1 sulfotransferase family protein [Pseudoxanthomonas sacheonensis]